MPNEMELKLCDRVYYDVLDGTEVNHYEPLSIEEYNLVCDWEDIDDSEAYE